MKNTCVRMLEPQLQPCPLGNHPRPGAWKRAILAGGMAILGAAFFSGCATDKPASASFASVVIASQSGEQIQATTVLVFEEAGYTSEGVPGGAMVFEKEGSRGDQVLYGGLGGAAYGGAVTIRVRAEIVDLVAQDARRLQCTAYLVNDAGGGIFEDKQKLANFRSGPYQKLLDEVALKLKFK